MPTRFGGFHPRLIQFLAELEHNNDREWFSENRERYEEDVRGPALAFIRAMAPALARISPHLRAVDKKVGGSLMRVHRDVRFSKDKSPYKTNVGIQFRHSAGKDVHAPGFYVHIALDTCFLGAGLWRPERDALAGIRKTISERPGDWTRLWKAKGLAPWSLGGESLKRPPRGFDPEHPQIDEIKRKDFIAVEEIDHETVLDPAFVKYVGSRFRGTRNFMEFLTGAVGLEF
jgi:uncharacterized protein (TIGR02453 family)